MQLLQTLLLVVGADALRKFKHRSDANVSSTSMYPRGVVSNLITFGAPKVSAPALANPNTGDGCFPGWRVVNKKKSLIYAVDAVPALMKTLPYAHKRIDPVFLYQSGKGLTEQECGWRGRTVETPSTSLHGLDLYVERASEVSYLRDAARVALAVSYMHDSQEAAAFVRARGFGLVGSAVDRDEASHLIQNPSTLDCFLTFEGSDRFSDWTENLQIVRTSFCGLPEGIHTGFKKAVRGIVAIDAFARNVRPKLGHCRNVEAVGHSLGGAIATLFTACTHNWVHPGEDGYDDFQHFWFQKKNTQRMNYL